MTIQKIQEKQTNNSTINFANDYLLATLYPQIPLKSRPIFWVIDRVIVTDSMIPILIK